MLRINDLNISYNGKPAVKNISLKLNKKEIAVIVGESGSGKSTLLRSIINLLSSNANIISGSILFNDKNILDLTHRELEKIRGKDISVIFQNPESFFDPSVKIKNQFYELVKAHRQIFRSEAYIMASTLLKSLQLDNCDRVLNSYPFELSGGMCQRVAIAFAVALHPKIVLADEPTSALDVTIQSEIIDLMIKIYNDFNTSFLIVTHNMGVVSKIADMVGVMYRGKMVEWGTKDEIMINAQHDYTKTLLKSVPKLQDSNFANDIFESNKYIHGQEKRISPVHDKIYFSKTHWILND